MVRSAFCSTAFFGFDDTTSFNSVVFRLLWSSLSRKHYNFPIVIKAIKYIFIFFVSDSHKSTLSIRCYSFLKKKNLTNKKSTLFSLKYLNIKTIIYKQVNLLN
jgi:hypothetical protein